MGWIEKYGHGGDLLTAMEAFGVGQEELIDFSANINPLGPPPNLMKELKQGLDSVVHYPDPAHRLFRHRLADRLGIDQDFILAGNGAAECIALALQAIAPSNVGVIYPCFSEYEQLSSRFGARVNGCYGKKERDFKPEMQDLHTLFQQNDLVFVGHPNNPTGAVYDYDELKKMAEWAEETETYLIIDEAFIDFLPIENQPTLIHELDQYRYVIIIRSMTKFYAIPGLRLGYAVAHPSIIQLMKEKQVTWSVNQLALIAGEFCLQQEEYEKETRMLIEQERDYLYSEIEKQFGWKVWAGKANFLLVRLPPFIIADELQFAIGKKGFMIRNCSMYQGLSPQDFRIAVRTRAENSRLLEAFTQFVREKGEIR